MRNAILASKVLGTAKSWDGWDYTDRWGEFSPAPDMAGILPACATLEIEMFDGTWTAFDSMDDVIATGRIAVTFTATALAERPEGPPE